MPQDLWTALNVLLALRIMNWFNDVKTRVGATIIV